MKILVLGCNGQLGRCLNDQLRNLNYEVTYTSREQIDISDFELTKDKIIEIAPDVIINATAFTAVDKAEENQKTADLINHLSVKNIANICNRLNNFLIHVSTDYVFDGNSDVPYKEDDQTNPQSIYGKTKLNGELAIQSSGCKHIIIRTAWVFSEYGNNFLKTMLRLAPSRDELNIVDDQIGCPTYCQDIAKAILSILDSLKSSKLESDLYHFSGNFPCTWAEFSQYILDEAVRINLIKVRPKVLGITTKQFPTLAKRPSYSQLNSDKIRATFGVESSDFILGIRSAFKAINQKNY
jgi:dTDP-4-dehydrorhamnose reductase